MKPGDTLQLACDLVFYIQCREVRTADITQLLAKSSPNTFRTYGIQDVTNVIEKMNVLRIFDGYNESTRDAEELLKSVFEIKGGLQTVLVTSQHEHGLRIPACVVRETCFSSHSVVYLSRIMNVM